MKLPQQYSTRQVAQIIPFSKQAQSCLMPIEKMSTLLEGQKHYLSRDDQDRLFGLVSLRRKGVATFVRSGDAVNVNHWYSAYTESFFNELSIAGARSAAEFSLDNIHGRKTVVEVDGMKIPLNMSCTQQPTVTFDVRNNRAYIAVNDQVFNAFPISSRTKP